jgi:hypothetical protein
MHSAALPRSLSRSRRVGDAERLPTWSSVPTIAPQDTPKNG